MNKTICSIIIPSKKGYIFEPGILQTMPSSTVFPMDIVLKKIINEQKKLIRGYIVKQDFMDLGDKRSYLDTFMKFLT
jgi:mannose-1-phosphate guanylyltransferase